MHIIQLKSHHVGSDGWLQVELPDVHDTEIEVIIIYQPVQEAKNASGLQIFLVRLGLGKVNLWRELLKRKQ